jgi:hypothetical protein
MTAKPMRPISALFEYFNGDDDKVMADDIDDNDVDDEKAVAEKVDEMVLAMLVIRRRLEEGMDVTEEEDEDKDDVNYYE